jgi:hypothetical protein
VRRLRSAYRTELGGGRRGRSERNLSTVGQLWSTVEDDADTAAMSFADSAANTEALVSVDLAVTAYLDYTMDERAPRPGQAIQDLDDCWPPDLGSGESESTLDDDYADIERQHTILTGPIRRVHDLSLHLAADRIEVAPLTADEQRELATRSLLIRGRVRWYTFATAPAQWWLARAEKDVAMLRRVLNITDDEDFAGEGDESPPMLLRHAEYRLLSQGDAGTPRRAHRAHLSGRRSDRPRRDRQAGGAGAHRA